MEPQYIRMGNHCDATFFFDTYCVPRGIDGYIIVYHWRWLIVNYMCSLYTQCNIYIYILQTTDPIAPTSKIIIAGAARCLSLLWRGRWLLTSFRPTRWLTILHGLQWCLSPRLPRGTNRAVKCFNDNNLYYLVIVYIYIHYISCIHPTGTPRGARVYNIIIM